jgi:dihydroneopterin aldolase
MDAIQIKEIKAYGYIGLLPEEQILGQWFTVDLTLWVDLIQAGDSDQIEDTVDYRAAIAIVKRLITTEKFALVERLAKAIATEILTLDLVEQVRVQLTKISPPIPDFGGQIVIDITRSRLR